MENYLSRKECFRVFFPSILSWMADVAEYRKSLHSLTTLSSGEFAVRQVLPGGPSSSASSSSSSSVTRPFTAQSLRELKIQSQVMQSQSPLLKQLELEMAQSPQAAILRRMKEEEQQRHNPGGGAEDEAADELRLLRLERDALVRAPLQMPFSISFSNK